MNSFNIPEILRRKLEKLFPNVPDRDAAKETLSDYGLESYERESERVRLAILKLSGPDLGKVREYVQTAKVDYRDVLAWAEYPEQVRAPTWKMDPEERKRMEERDRAQYEAWLCKE